MPQVLFSKCFCIFGHASVGISVPKVLLSTTSLMPGFYRWLLNTGGTPLEALSPLKSPCFPLILNGAAEALVAHTLQWHRLEREPAAAALHQGTEAGAEGQKVGPMVLLPHEGLHPLHHIANGTEQNTRGEAKPLKPCLHLLTSTAPGIH